MATKTKKPAAPTTGFRNGHLFCFNCGAMFDPQPPQPLGFAADLMKIFHKHHKNCSKTWTVPVVDQSLSVNEKVLWWLGNKNGEHGTSSMFMCNVLSQGLEYRRLSPPDFGLDKISHPHDVDDFRRCYLLLQTVPEWKEKLHLMKAVSPVWEKLVDNWDLFTQLLEDQLRGKKNDLYALMKDIGC